MLQPPQFWGSLLVSTQLLLHKVRPPEQRQVLAWQLVPAVQAWLHVPQLPLSVARFTQAPLQALVGEVH
jgi:hypothetical protein